ncbi:hypothetical protein BJD99_19585 [Rhodococcus sp. 1163]|uniref:DUF3558 domain-containing protein n=1 Tax=Rhodococcus sp. 1163 TaxID=1905289 RepID=UPI000A06E8A9|nr:DUF3558 domain-containing protein [Rhodococcus sp. 1163]ORI18924.1 hypothetical protein BJD99_19585 [Rhodococcus sp. 1163]
MRRGVLATAAALTLLTSCGQPVEGNAVAGEPSLADQFDPCTIPDDAIARTGLDPDSRRAEADIGISTKDWKRCHWQDASTISRYSYHVLFSQKFTLADVRTNPDNVGFSDVMVGTRAALLYRLRVSDSKGICDLAFDTEEGVVIIFANSQSPSDTAGQNLCEIVRRHTEDVESYLPPS